MLNPVIGQKSVVVITHTAREQYLLSNLVNIHSEYTTEFQAFIESLGSSLDTLSIN